MSAVVTGVALKRVKRFLRNFCTKKVFKLEPIPAEGIEKSVFISQSNDIYTNLALEDWLYRNYDFTKHHVLMLWKSNPCVVVGRHQNPWLESNKRGCEKNGICIARRNSGGGTVYHDFGNLNLSFFSPRERYNRKYNLELMTRALYREWGIQSIVNEKEDIVVQNKYKISGTAAKLGRPNAYHHCTLLIDANKALLHKSLFKIEHGIMTNATQSVRSPVINLKDLNPHVTVDKLINAIGWEYLRIKPLRQKEAGVEPQPQQNGFQLINPTEEWFPGLERLVQEFRSWEWNYGMTPNFMVTRRLEFSKSGVEKYRMKLTIHVEKGIVKSIKLTSPNKSIGNDSDEDSPQEENASVLTNLCGKRYFHGLVDSIVTATGCKSIEPTPEVDEKDLAATQ